MSKDPWSELPCGRIKCTACRNPDAKPKSGPCRTRSVVYQSYCVPCQELGETVQYIGESARSTFERGLEHLGDVSCPSKTSHMRDHLTEAHQGEDRIPEETFCIRVLRSEPSPLQRQVAEAIEIARAKGVVLNKKEEYNRCLLPSLRIDPGWERPQLPGDASDTPDDGTLLHHLQTGKKKREGTEDNTGMETQQLQQVKRRRFAKGRRAPPQDSSPGTYGSSGGT